MQHHRAWRRLLMVELRSPILWPCGNRHKRYLCLRLPRTVVEEAGVEEEDEARTSKTYNARAVCYTALNPKGSFIVCREVLASTGILNIYDVRLGERKVPWANVRFQWVSGSPQRQSREKFCARISSTAGLRRWFITVYGIFRVWSYDLCWYKVLAHENLVNVGLKIWEEYILHANLWYLRRRILSRKIHKVYL